MRVTHKTLQRDFLAAGLTSESPVVGGYQLVQCNSYSYKNAYVLEQIVSENLAVRSIKYFETGKHALDFLRGYEFALNRGVLKI